MILRIEHETSYSYTEALRYSIQVLRLTPPISPRQTLHDWRIETPGRLEQSTDGYGNTCHTLVLTKSVQEIRIRVVGTAEVHPEVIEPEDTLPPELFLRPTPLTTCEGDLKDFGHFWWTKTQGLSRRDQLQELSQMILERIPYIKGMTHAHTTASDAFDIGAGVCQDHTHIFLALCRAHGIPARYVSGYLCTSDSTHVATHAWAEAWTGESWESWDISNQCPAAHSHLKLAIGLDYLEASPVRGSRIGGGLEQLCTLAQVQGMQQ
jgi:transglutaminase-like putative cysteine protease